MAFKILKMLSMIFAATYKSEHEKNRAVERLRNELSHANSQASADYQYLCCAIAQKEAKEVEVQKHENELSQLNIQLNASDKQIERTKNFQLSNKIKEINRNIESKKGEIKDFENKIRRLRNQHSDAVTKVNEKQREKDQAMNARVDNK